jgi:hypothetical protein
MYVDESGDTGIPGASKYFCLSGLVVHESRWCLLRDSLVQYRNELFADSRYKLSPQVELHAGEMLSKPGRLNRIPLSRRMEIIKLHANRLAAIPELRLIPVVVEKELLTSGFDVFSESWTRLLSRFDNGLRGGDFGENGDTDEQGLVVADGLASSQLKTLARTLQNSGTSPRWKIVEDPVMRDSKDSMFIQAADATVFLLRQFHEPNKHFKKHRSGASFAQLDRIVDKSIDGLTAGISYIG